MPPISSLTDSPETVQTVCVSDASETARPELDVADTLIVDAAYSGPTTDGRVMVWSWRTIKLVPTGGAAAKVALPACVTSIEQVPKASMVAVLPATLHTVGVVDLKDTARPELAVAVRLIVAPTSCVAIFAKVRVWLALVTVKLWLTVAAGPYVEFPPWLA